VRVCSARIRTVAGEMRASSIKFSSALMLHIWQAAQKYGGAPPITSWRRSSKATRSALGMLKSSIASERGMQADMRYYEN
jgi:hypothetical protein